MLLVPLAPHDAPVAWLIVSVAVGSFGSVVYNINQVSYRQAISPTAIQGRMNATMRFLVWGTIPIGAILGGLVATVGRRPQRDLDWRVWLLSAVPLRAPLARAFVA